MTAAVAAATEDLSSEQLDMDSIHILPLSIIPFETPGLKRARLIKNSALESVIELYQDESSGSGQVAPEKLDQVFRWTGNEGYEDQRIANSLAALNSYDVYCLRIDLRRLGIEVDEHTQLSLSEAKQSELVEYMRYFTGPLLQQVYGSSDVDVSSYSDLLNMFANPDKEQALTNLKLLAEKLEIDVLAVPTFLEEYGDIYLSLAYYKAGLDEIVPKLEIFYDQMGELQNSYQMKQDRGLMTTCTFLREQLGDISSSITGRFESFDRHSQSMWEDLNATSFQKVRAMIEGHHATIGGVLCGLTVKMNIWGDRIGRRNVGPVQQAEFIRSHMRSGIDRIRQIEDSAPSISDL